MFSFPRLKIIVHHLKRLMHRNNELSKLVDWKTVFSDHNDMQHILLLVQCLECITLGCFTNKWTICKSLMTWGCNLLTVWIYVVLFQVKDPSDAISATWVSFRNTFFSDTRKSTVVSDYRHPSVAHLILFCESLCLMSNNLERCCLQERSHSAVTSATCVSFRSTTWRGIRGLTAERSRTDVRHANRSVGCWVSWLSNVILYG